MKKMTAIILCVLMALGGFACSAQSLVQDLTEKAEQIGEVGEQIGGIGEQIGENLGELGEQLGENLGELGEQLGENLGELGEQLGEGLGGFGEQIANPFVDYESLEEAAKAAGFTLTVPTQNGAGKPIIQVMDGKMIQVIFDETDPQLYIRKQAGDEDISGDYNEYAEITTATVGDRTVTLKGNDGKVSTAIWTADGYSYAVLYEEPHTVESACRMIEQIH